MTKKEGENASDIEAPAASEEKKKKKNENIEDLPGIGESTAGKLREAGYDSIETLAYCMPAELVEIGGIGEGTAAKVINLCRQSLDMGFESAIDVLARREKIKKITTGSKELDNLLGGGIETQAITECYGKFGSGKCVSKDTPLLFFNPGVAHLDSIKNVYEKYVTVEQSVEGGFASVPSRDVHVLSLNADGVLVKQRVQCLFKEFVPTISVVKTNRGTILETTKNHPLLTLSEEGLVWKPVGMLSEGDYIASAKQFSFDSSSDLTVADAYFLGLFVAEGTSNPLSITNFDQKILDKITIYVSTKFGRKPTISRNGHLVLLNKDVKQFLGALADSNSATKFVPESVLNANDAAIAAFLAGYFDGDGSINTTVDYTTKSELLAKQIPYLLSRLGVEVTLSMKKTFYRGFVTDPQSKAKLGKLLTHATKSLDCLTTRNSSSNYGIPANLVSRIARRSWNKISGSHRRNQLFSKKTLSEQQMVVYLNYLSRSPYADTLNRETLSTLVGMLYGKISLLEECRKKLELNPDPQTILDILSRISLKSTDLAKAAGLKKSTFENYLHRQRIPEEKTVLLAKVMREKITAIFADQELARDLKVLKMLTDTPHLGWERITSIQEKEYNDYVYDLTVENTHNFVGGIKPMLLHNSQVGFQLCVNAQLPIGEGGLASGVLFVDSEGTFRPERIKQMALARGLDPLQVLANIQVARAFNSDHQILLVEKAENMIKGGKIKLIVVDSITSAFRSDYVGRGTLSERQQLLNKHMHMLLKFADRYNVAVYITNQVMDNPGILFGDPTLPIGGHVLAHISTYRVYLRRSKEDRRIAKLVDSPSLPDGECVFAVREAGIQDV